MNPNRTRCFVLMAVLAAAPGWFVRIPLRHALSLAPMTAFAASPIPSNSALLDTLQFGDPPSEAAHNFQNGGSETITGLLGTPARHLLPLNPPAWNGGHMDFMLRVDPAALNYVTVRFSGDETNLNRLLLFVNGKQIGYRHLGDVDQLDFGTAAPAYNGRFYYTTTPLPLSLTQGRTSIDCEIRASGEIWPYGTNWGQYQKVMTTPSRGIYSVYSGTSGYFVPPAGETQGNPPADLPTRAAPGPEVLDQLKARVNGTVTGLLNQPGELSQMQLKLLAKTYNLAWCAGYHSPQLIDRVVSGLDNLYREFVKNPKLAESEPSTWNPDWFGLGPSGQILWMLAPQIAPRLDEAIAGGNGGRIARRDAYATMLVACRDWHRQHRRLYSNQTMINDLYGIYYANRGLEVVAPKQALAEPEVRRYLYESVGLQPWRDSDPGAATGPAEREGKNWGVGSHYLEITAKGLTKELGYVGTYGEVIDWATDIYNATRPAPGQPGDPLIEAQLVKIARTRANFRYPAEDSDGNRAMRLEQIIGWRDSHFPGDVTYAQRQTWDASPLEVANDTRDPYLVGYAQQMLADNQYFVVLAEQLKNPNLRIITGLVDAPDEYEAIAALPASPHRLPMSWDQPDYVFTDEEDGVVALKHGNQLLYASLYWRARFSINNLARVHFMTPKFDRIAVVAQNTQFEPSGLYYTRPNWTNMDTGNGGVKYPDNAVNALAGAQEPIAKIPDDVPFKPGDENPYAGRGEFYTLRYGPYLIGLNMSGGKSFTLPAPSGDGTVKDLVTGSMVQPGTMITVGPRTAAVLYLGE